jgi:ribosomal protein S7
MSEKTPEQMLSEAMAKIAPAFSDVDREWLSSLVETGVDLAMAREFDVELQRLVYTLEVYIAEQIAKRLRKFIEGVRAAFKGANRGLSDLERILEDLEEGVTLAKHSGALMETGEQADAEV